MWYVRVVFCQTVSQQTSLFTITLQWAGVRCYRCICLLRVRASVGWCARVCVTVCVSVNTESQALFCVSPTRWWYPSSDQASLCLWVLRQHLHTPASLTCVCVATCAALWLVRRGWFVATPSSYKSLVPVAHGYSRMIVKWQRSGIRPDGRICIVSYSVQITFCCC